MTKISVGQEFGKLTVLAPGVIRLKKRYFPVRCVCGKEKTDVRGDHLLAGLSRSCGSCEKPDQLHKHGHTRLRWASRTYQSWAGIIQRTTNPKNTKWPIYGGRGITVCERWKSFDNFLADMGERPEGRSIDRIDNDDGYHPGNCRWATLSEQNKNRRYLGRKKRKTP